MKYILSAFIILLFVLPALAQKEKPVPPDLPRSDNDNQVYYMEVVTMDEILRDELYKRARIWVKEFYKNPAGVVEELDSVTGKMVLNPQFATYRILKNEVKAQSAIVNYTLELGFKDSKYRYEIRDINLKAPSYYPIEKLFSENDPNVLDNYNTLTEAGKTFDDLIKNLKASMLEPSVKVKEDDW